MKGAILAGAAAALTSLSAQAQFIAYDNTASPQTSGGDILYTDVHYPEIGDEINLIGGANIVTNFKFEYVYTGPSSDNATGILRFRELVPAGGGFTVSTGAPLLESDPFDLQNGFHSVDTGAISVAVPGRFVWTVEFLNTGAGTPGGLLFYNGAGVGDGPGQSANDHWEFNTDTGNWTLYNNTLGIDNFAAQVTVVPEPGTMALAIAGGVAMLAARRRKK